MTRVGCATVCRALGEPLRASAPANSSAWLLIEHNGPWPSFGLPPGLPPEVVDLVGEALALRVRPQLIRRPAARRQVAPHRVFVAWTRGDDVWLERRDLADLRELCELDVAALARGRRPGFGATVPAATGALLLVCTHGRRDACCAQFGRPAAVALADRYGDAVWETTHVGGDRFAANLVCLPFGTYHGQLDTWSAVPVGGHALRGRVDLGHYRGRAGSHPAVQAAEYFARQATGVLDVLAVREAGPASPRLPPRSPSGAPVPVDLEVAGRALRVVVRARPAGCARLTSCSEGSVGEPVEYVLERIDEPALPGRVSAARSRCAPGRPG